MHVVDWRLGTGRLVTLHELLGGYTNEINLPEVGVGWRKSNGALSCERAPVTHAHPGLVARWLARR